MASSVFLVPASVDMSTENAEGVGMSMSTASVHTYPLILGDDVFLETRVPCKVLF